MLGWLEVSACSGPMSTQRPLCVGAPVAECWPGLPESCLDLALLHIPCPPEVSPAHHERVTVVMISLLIALGFSPSSLRPCASPLAAPFPKLWPIVLSSDPLFAECLRGHGLIWTPPGCRRWKARVSLCPCLPKSCQWPVGANGWQATLCRCMQWLTWSQKCGLVISGALLSMGTKPHITDVGLMDCPEQPQQAAAVLVSL